MMYEADCEMMMVLFFFIRQWRYATENVYIRVVQQVLETCQVQKRGKDTPSRRYLVQNDLRCTYVTRTVFQTAEKSRRQRKVNLCTCLCV